jgi:hypothetical protein
MTEPLTSTFSSRPDGAFVTETLEVRWFVLGTLSPSAFPWAHGAGLTQAAPRTDRYVVLPGVDGVGIKLREGRVEVKARSGSLGSRALGTMSGEVERWVKWSQPVGSGVSWDQGPGVRIVDVDKTRWSLWRDGALIELTALKADGQFWWTAAVEIAGSVADPSRLANLCEPFESLEQARGALTLDASRGYASWLERLTRTA